MDNKKEMENKVIESYKNDEKMMILVYAQWCINNDLDPKSMYTRAYPDQIKNNALREALEMTDTKEETENIHDETVLQVIQVFGKDELAFIVQKAIDRRGKECI